MTQTALRAHILQGPYPIELAFLHTERAKICSIHPSSIAHLVRLIKKVDSNPTKKNSLFVSVEKSLDHSMNPPTPKWIARTLPADIDRCYMNEMHSLVALKRKLISQCLIHKERKTIQDLSVFALCRVLMHHVDISQEKCLFYARQYLKHLAMIFETHSLSLLLSVAKASFESMTCLPSNRSSHFLSQLSYTTVESIKEIIAHQMLDHPHLRWSQLLPFIENHLRDMQSALQEEPFEEILEHYQKQLERKEGFLQARMPSRFYHMLQEYRILPELSHTSNLERAKTFALIFLQMFPECSACFDHACLKGFIFLTMMQI